MANYDDHYSSSLSSKVSEGSVFGDDVDVDFSLRTSMTSRCLQTRHVSLRGRVHFYPSNLLVNSNTEPSTHTSICYEGISGNYVHQSAVLVTSEVHGRTVEVGNPVSSRANASRAPRTLIVDCCSDSDNDLLIQKTCLVHDAGAVSAPRPPIIDCCSDSDSDPPSTPIPVSCNTYSIDRDQLFPGAVFDSHCHLDFIYRRLKGQGKGAVKSLQQCLAMDGEDLGSSFGGCVANFCDPMDWCQGPSGKLISKDIEDSTKDRRVFLSIGCHPHFADRMRGNRTEQLAMLVSGRSQYLPRKVVALGECGLDYSRKNTVEKDLQKQVFTDQLKIAMQFKLPLVLHIRDAEADGYDVMEAAGVPVDWPIHRHCFTGGWEEASLWLDKYRGSKIGITGIVTYQSRLKVLEMVRKIPLDRLLLETDAPYFLPARTDRTKHPWNCALPGHIIHVAAEVAAIKGVNLGTVLEQNLMNVHDIYKVGKVGGDGADIGK